MAWRWLKSWRTAFSGVSFVCARCSCACSFARSDWAVLRTTSLSKRRTMPCLALRKTRASPIAVCATFTAASVSVTAAATSSTLSPAAWIISAVIAAFSTKSSAVFDFSCAAAQTSSKVLESFASSSFCLTLCSACAIALLILPSSALICCWDVRIEVPSCANCFCMSPPGALRCASITFRNASFNEEADPFKAVSAACKPSIPVYAPW
mmetsp:Transcript_41249/g.118657  ORF Transcript_41249/g.118657 Transcript_41249/m.118657 type:complete len:209 (+) Transcript_41249:2243-2869(+)